MSTSRGRRGGSSVPTPAEKVCASCGRSFAWRSKWADSWDEVRYCSDACRRRGVTEADRELERRLVDALRRGARGAVVPLDALEPEGSDADAGHREQVRRAARRLVARGEGEMVQGGRRVDPSTARGPVGLRLPR